MHTNLRMSLGKFLRMIRKWAGSAPQCAKTSAHSPVSTVGSTAA